MLNRIAAIVVAGGLAVGCGASRPQYSSQDYKVAVAIYAEQGSLDEVATHFDLASRSAARSLVRSALIALGRELNKDGEDGRQLLPGEQTLPGPGPFAARDAAPGQ